MSRFSPILPALLLFGSRVFGQEALAPGPVVPPLPTAANPANPAIPNNAPLGEMVRLQFPKTDVRDVLAFYERITKKRLIFDNQVQGEVNIVVNGEISRDEAIRIIEINLLLNGFTLVPVERSNIVKVLGLNKNPRSAAIPIISDEALIPDGEHVITFLAKLRYADPLELQQTLTTFVVPAQGQFTNMTALPKAQAILITENTATIRGLLRIIREIDVPPAEVLSEFVTLERADAKDVIEKLTAIFEKTPSPSGAPGAAPRPNPARAGGATTPEGTQAPPGATAEVTSPNSVEINGGTLSEDSIIIGKIKLTADIRTNRIHVVTRPTNLPFIRKLIHEFDSSSPFGEPSSRALRFVSAGDVFDVVVQAITEPGVKADTGAAGAAGQRPAGQGGNAGNAGGRSPSGSNNGSDGGGGGLNVSEGLATEAVDTTPRAAIVGTAKIIADQNANAIIVIGNADVKAKVFKLLDKLDQRIPQVMLHTVIGELNLNQREQFGVDYILRNAGLGLSPIVVNSTGTGTGTTTGTDGTGTGISTTVPTTGSGNNFASINGTTPGLNFNNLLNQNTIRSIATAGGGGLSGFVSAGNSLTAIVTALENSNRFRVVSRPSVFTRNNKKAIIASGQEIAVPVNIQSSVNSVNNGSAGIVSNSSVQYKNVTLKLEVVPLINSDREVALDILQENNEVSGSTRIDNNDIPTIATRYVKTSVTVPNEGTLVLGGLIKVSENRTRSGIPILSDIPLIGSLFSSKSKEKIRTELVILIRPVVSWTPPESIQLRERAQEFLNIEPDLESTIYPSSLHQTSAPERMLRKPGVALREQQDAPKFRP